ncbi:hypothetical protein EV13_2780 [Prochlorococcus sp. MIT 0702]|nr:hypothetical protein EV12_2732 [Prochlorococcus sp. MIT 0701]KGG26004.1 hypothetical protein EV13_2780 [Prochlorococcus sp. MIT 0702]KGG30816.1 hypothetical protein EV14_2753 [Prochlorococcus sp. MIT 0703]
MYFEIARLKHLAPYVIRRSPELALNTELHERTSTANL